MPCAVIIIQLHDKARKERNFANVFRNFMPKHSEERKTTKDTKVYFPY